MGFAGFPKFASAHSAFWIRRRSPGQPLQHAPGGDQDNSEAALSGWLRARESNDRGIWTDRMWLSQGKPGKDFIVNRIHFDPFVPAV